MPRTFCLTRDQVEDRERQAEIARRDVAQRSGIQGTGSGGYALSSTTTGLLALRPGTLFGSARP